MKEYKYTIDGKEYQVVIGEIVDNVANVTVNGEEYKVEMEPEAEPEKKKACCSAGKFRTMLQLQILTLTQMTLLRLHCQVLLQKLKLL